MHLLSRVRFTLVFLLTAVFGAKLLFQGGPSFAVTIGVAVTLLLVVELLAHNLPTAIRSGITANCRRPDGSWSIRRERVEANAVTKLRNDLLIVITMLVLTSHGMIWLVDTEVIPLSIGSAALSKLQPSADEWRANLDDEQEQYGRWLQNKGFSQEAIHTRMEMLWEFWPGVMVIGLGWTGLVFSVVRGVYFRGLHDLYDSIQFRRLQYQLRDLDVAVDQSDGLPAC